MKWVTLLIDWTRAVGIPAVNRIPRFLEIQFAIVVDEMTIRNQAEQSGQGRRVTDFDNFGTRIYRVTNQQDV